MSLAIDMEEVKAVGMESRVRAADLSNIEEVIDQLANDGRLGIIAKRIAIESGVDWPSLDGEAQDEWHEYDKRWGTGA